MKTMLCGLIALLIIAFAQVPAWAEEPDPIGAAQVINGQVRALNEDPTVVAARQGNAFQDLDRDMPVYLGDQVVSGPGAGAQFIFKDGTLMTMSENSAVNLNDYFYSRKNKKNWRLDFTMGPGTFRFVTGKIAKKNAEQFKLQSPLGIIGIRGTDIGSVVETLGGGDWTEKAAAFLSGQKTECVRGAREDHDVRETHAHLGGSKRKPIQFTDFMGKVVEIPKGYAIVVTEDAGAGEPQEISEEIETRFDVVKPNVNAPPPSGLSGFESAADRGGGDGGDG